MKLFFTGVISTSFAPRDELGTGSCIMPSPNFEFKISCAFSRMASMSIPGSVEAGAWGGSSCDERKKRRVKRGEFNGVITVLGYSQRFVASLFAPPPRL